MKDKQSILLYITLSIATVALIVGVIGLLQHPADGPATQGNAVNTLPAPGQINQTPIQPNGASMNSGTSQSQ